MRTDQESDTVSKTNKTKDGLGLSLNLNDQSCVKLDLDGKSKCKSDKEIQKD